MRSWANFNVNVIFVITTGGKTIPIWIISSEFIKFWILNKSRSGILNKKKCPRVVAGVPADFESRHQKLSIDAKILLEDHLWRFRVLLALYDQTTKTVDTFSGKCWRWKYHFKNWLKDLFVSKISIRCLHNFLYMESKYFKYKKNHLKHNFFSRLS